VSAPESEQPPQRGKFRRFFSEPIKALFYDDLRDLPDLTVGDHDSLLADPLPLMPPYVQRIRDIRERIGELWSARAVDEGTPTVLDGEIERMAEVRYRSIRLKKCERQIRIDYREAELDAAIQAAADKIATIDRKIEDIEEQIRRSDAERATRTRSRDRRQPGESS